MAEGRRHIDDAPSPLGQHHAKLMLHAQQCAEDVCVEGGSVAFGGLLCYRARFAFGAGAIDSHIQTTKPATVLSTKLRTSSSWRTSDFTNSASAPSLPSS